MGYLGPDNMTGPMTGIFLGLIYLSFHCRMIVEELGRFKVRFSSFQNRLKYCFVPAH